MLAELRDGSLTLTELHRFRNAPVYLPSGLYWNTLGLFSEICEGIRRAASAASRLEGIGIDTWGVDFGLIGPDGALVELPRHYRDPRTLGMQQRVFEIVPRSAIFRETGIQFMDINSLYQLCAIKKDSPHVLDAASALLFMPDLFNYFLTGVVASERTIASTSQFYDPVRKHFATDLLGNLGIDSSLLAPLREPGTELGPVLPQIAGACSWKKAATVYATASHDTAAAVAAVPASRNDVWAYISSGTWSLMGVELDTPIIDEVALEANFTNEAGAGGKIRFLKNIPGLWVLQECRRAWAREGREYSYAELTQGASAAKPIGSIIDVDEFVEPGDYPQRIRDWCRKTGQEVPGDEGSMTRVILQSIAARYREVLDLLEKTIGKRIEVIHIVGGGSRNRFLNQLTANATERRVMAGPAEATAIGNALVQAMGAGKVGSIDEIRGIVQRSFEVEEFLPGR